MKKYFVALMCTSLLAVACTREMENAETYNSSAKPARENSVLPEDSGYVPGVVLVQFSDDMTTLLKGDLNAGILETKSVDVNRVFRELDVESITPVFPEEECPEEFRERERAFGLQNFYYVQYKEGKVPVTHASRQFSALSGIVSAEPQPQVYNAGYFNDPLMNNQWHYVNNNTPGADVNCLPVWENFTTGNPKVIVSVVDQGVDLEHEDLAWNCLPGGPDGSRNFADNNYDVEPMSHGSHVAGTIAAVNNNGKGVAGVAGGDYKNNRPGVKIMSCQFFGTKRNGSSADAIRWGANHGAVISSNSWGYVVDINEDGRISADELERAKSLRIDAATKAAVDYFIKYAGCDASGNQKDDSPMKGGLVVFSAGNDNIPYGAPANYEAILSVGATDINGRRSSFSNYGDWVDICAPGSSIYSTLPGNRYGGMSGTSMACPHVSGVAALVVSYNGGPGFTADLLWTKLVNGGKKDFIPGSTSTPIGPLVDAYGAILYGDSGTPLPVNEYAVAGQSNNINFTWNVTATTKGSAAYAAMLYVSKDKAALENMTDLANPGKGIFKSSYLTSTNNVGDQVTGSVGHLEFETEYYVTMAPYSYDNGFATLAPIKTVKTGTNNPPFVTIDLNPIPSHRNYEIWTIPITVGDPDGHEVQVSYKPGSAADSIQPDAANGGYMIMVNGPLTPGGTFTGTVTVKDEYGLATSTDVTFTIIDNIAPVVVNSIDNQMFTNPGEERTFTLSDLFEDADGEPLAMDIQVSDKKAFHAVNDGETLHVTSLGYGVARISVIATDARGASANMTFGAVTREASVEYSAYPNPVEDTLYLSTGKDEEETSIAVYGSTGAVVYQGTQTTSAFFPATVDMSNCAPGRYSLVFTYGGKQYTTTIIKK